MKKILLILVLMCTTIAFSQEKNFEDEVKKISNRIELITQTEKANLKEKIQSINEQLERKEITQEEANELKKKAAEFHAKLISDKVAVEEVKLQLLVQDKANGKIKNISEEKPYFEDESFTIGNKTVNIRVRHNDSYDKNRKGKWENYRTKKNRRTTTQFVFAMGVNNTIYSHRISTLDERYKFWKSRFYEIGWTWKTRMNEQPSKLYVKYGMSFLWNNLRLKDNQFFVLEGPHTIVDTHPERLHDSRLRHVQMNFPVHLEWDFSKNGEYSDGAERDRTGKSLRLGIGGFAGLRLSTRQYLEYDTDYNIDFPDSSYVEVEELQKNNFNTNLFTYGVSTYIAWKDLGFYVKYDMNSLFKGVSSERNISLGVRLDIN